MWRANVGRSETAEFRIEPEFGQRAENGIESSSSSDGCDVLQEDVAGSNVANDADEVEVESAPLSVDAGPLPGKGQVLAGETACHQIDTAPETVCGERPHVRPDRSVVQVARRHPGSEDGRCVGFPLHISQTSASWEDAADGEVEGADAGKQADMAFGRYSQAIHLPAFRLTYRRRASMDLHVGQIRPFFGPVSRIG
jgi:hypothetical protein